jgi:hypothetical protein
VQDLTALQPLDSAARHLRALPLQLFPDLVGPVDLKVGLSDAQDRRPQPPTRSARWRQGRVALARLVASLA